MKNKDQQDPDCQNLGNHKMFNGRICCFCWGDSPYDGEHDDEHEDWSEDWADDE